LEEIITDMNHSGEKLNVLTNLPKELRSPEEVETRRRLNLINNARNRDIYTREHSQGTLNFLNDLTMEKEYDNDEGWEEFSIFDDVDEDDTE
jgi:hypothetical protein